MEKLEKFFTKFFEILFKLTFIGCFIWLFWWILHTINVWTESLVSIANSLKAIVEKL
jgi:hypothetical protein